MHSPLVLRFLGIGVALALAVPAQAQTRYGVGIGLNNFIESIFESPISIYVPIHTNKLRIEPEFGLFRMSESDGDFDGSSTAFQLGTSVATVLNDDDDTSVYVGGRIGIQLLKERFEGGGGEFEDTSTNFLIGPVLGGEHFFGENFSLGAEARLTFLSYGEGDTDNLLYTGGVLFARVYP